MLARNERAPELRQFVVCHYVCGFLYYYNGGLSADSMSGRIMPMRGIKRPTSQKQLRKIDRRDQINWLADQCCLSFHRTVVTDVLVADQFKLFILFYKTGWPPEQRLFPFVIVYMEPRPSEKSLLVSGRIFPISSPRGMGPCVVLTKSLGDKP